jgi:hypothetical protein
MVFKGCYRESHEYIASIIINSYFDGKILNITDYICSLYKTGEEYSQFASKLNNYYNGEFRMYCPYTYGDTAIKNILKCMTYKNAKKYAKDIKNDEYNIIYDYLIDVVLKMLSCIRGSEIYKKWCRENDDKDALRNINAMEGQIETLKKNMKNTESDKFKLETKNKELERELKKQKEIIEFLKGINNNEPPEECNICMDKIQDKNLKCGCTTRYCMPCARKINFKCCTCKKKINNLSV